MKTSEFMKALAGILAVLTVLAGIPLTSPINAQDTAAESAVSETDYTVDSTNSFGTLVAQEITESESTEEQVSENYEEGYTLTELVIEENVATITYDSLEAANIVVALYTEDGLQMLNSATVQADPEYTEATVTFEGEMPEYFMAEAFLLDTYDMSPLCHSYETPLYTKDMQDLLNSTVSDYDSDRVLNLDEDEETNFAVYTEETVVLESSESTNTVASIDEENMIYVIENADDTVKALTAGDIFLCPTAMRIFLS